MYAELFRLWCKGMIPVLTVALIIASIVAIDSIASINWKLMINILGGVVVFVWIGILLPLCVGMLRD